MYKKILASCVCMGFISLNGFANDDSALPIQTIQSLYSHSMEMHKHFDDFNNNELLYKFSTPSFKQIFDRDARLMDRTGDLGCIDHDIMWQTNDDGVGAKLYMQQYDYKYIMVGIGEKNGLEPRSLTYEMSCNDETCLVNDVLFGEKESFKKSVNECLKEQGA